MFLTKKLEAVPPGNGLDSTTGLSRILLQWRTSQILHFEQKHFQRHKKMAERDLTFRLCEVDRFAGATCDISIVLLVTNSQTHQRELKNFSGVLWDKCNTETETNTREIFGELPRTLLNLLFCCFLPKTGWVLLFTIPSFPTLNIERKKNHVYNLSTNALNAHISCCISVCVLFVLQSEIFHKKGHLVHLTKKLCANQEFKLTSTHVFALRNFIASISPEQSSNLVLLFSQSVVVLLKRKSAGDMFPETDNSKCRSKILNKSSPIPTRYSQMYGCQYSCRPRIK